MFKAREISLIQFILKKVEGRFNYLKTFRLVKLDIVIGVKKNPKSFAFEQVPNDSG